MEFSMSQPTPHHSSRAVFHGVLIVPASIVHVKIVVAKLEVMRRYAERVEVLVVSEVIVGEL